MRKLLALLVLLALGPSVCAAPDVPLAARSRNAQNYCLWHCIQTVGRHQGIAPLFHIVKEAATDPVVVRATGAVPVPYVVHYLQERSISHYYQSGSRDVTEINKAINQRNIGVVVIMRTSSPAMDHAVVLVGHDASTVRYIDPNRPGRIVSEPRYRFLEAWRGTAIFLDYPAPAPPQLPTIHRVLISNVLRPGG